MLRQTTVQLTLPDLLWQNCKFHSTRIAIIYNCIICDTAETLRSSLAHTHTHTRARPHTPARTLEPAITLSLALKTLRNIYITALYIERNIAYAPCLSMADEPTHILICRFSQDLRMRCAARRELTIPNCKYAAMAKSLSERNSIKCICRS